MKMKSFMMAAISGLLVSSFAYAASEPTALADDSGGQAMQSLADNSGVSNNPTDSSSPQGDMSNNNDNSNSGSSNNGNSDTGSSSPDTAPSDGSDDY
jgi:hypothetical protein